MKLKILATLSAVLSMAPIVSAASLSYTPNIPTSDILLSRGDEGGNTGSQATFGFRNADANGTEGTRGRGQSFVINATVGATYDISALSLALASGAGTSVRPDGDLTLTVFEYTGTGSTAAEQVNDASDWDSKLGGRSGAQLFSGSFEVAAGTSFASGDLMTFSFDSGELQLKDDQAYGFFLQYTLDTVDGLSVDVNIAFDADNNTVPDPAGLLLSTNPSAAGPGTGANGASASRDLNYFIQGTIGEVTIAEASSSATAPTEDILDSSPVGTVDTALFDEDADDNHARGQLFSLPNGIGSDYEVSAITIKKSMNQTYVDDVITLNLFEGAEAQWSSGSGHSTATDGDDYYVGTTVTPLYSESFSLNGAFNNNEYVTFQLSSPVTVNENSDFGFFLTYEPSDGANPDRFRHFENGTGGGRLSIAGSSHSATPDNSRKMVYYVQGTAVGVSNVLELGSPFQDRMVLQRDKPIKVWGVAGPDSLVSASINGVSASGTSDAEGNWEVELPSLAAGGPYTLSVTSVGETDTVSDVLVGDVWFCFGQSNMVFTLNQMAAWHTAYEDEIAGNDNIRCLKIDQDGSVGEEETAGMSWLPNSSSGSWTAVGSVFASQLHAATNVPVAIVWAAWGSSSIEGWMPLELADEFPYFAEMMQLYQSVADYRIGRTIDNRAVAMGYSSNTEAVVDLAANGWVGSNNSNEDVFMRTRPNIIYNKMVHPMRRYGISGFIWYQGEANGSNILDVAQYKFTLPRFADEYRERFGQGDLPFLGVQLPSFNTTNWPWFREAQDELLTVNNGHVAVTLDTGFVNNIHPTDKEPIGVRLALLARKFALGEVIEAESPRLSSISVSGNQVTIDFVNATGLMTNDGLSPAEFEVAGIDEVFHAVTSASVSRNKVTVSASAVSSPVAVRYAWSPAPVSDVNLVNGAGLPLAPFRTDAWELPGLGAQVPESIGDSYTVARDVTLTVPVAGVLANDFDLNGDALTANLVSDVVNGALSLNADGSFTYTPESGFAGSDSFTYQASDGSATSAAATVEIVVTGQSSEYYLWKSVIDWQGADDTANGDPDQDSVTNLLEFALGMDPLVADISGLPMLLSAEGGVTYDFSNQQAGVIYDVLLSTDLITWSDPPFATLTNASSTPVVIPSTEAEDGALFIRLRVTEE